MPIEGRGNSKTRARFSLKESEIRANQPQILSKIIHFEQIATLGSLLGLLIQSLPNQPDVLSTE
jgi:hypothetical protein